MRNIKLILSYDGTDFHGWQRQPGLRTIQQTLEDAILVLTQARPTATASSRTDAGVHALGQVVHFLTPSRHRPEIILKALNALCRATSACSRYETCPRPFTQPWTPYRSGTVT